ncbi:hypothetical protein Tco_0171442, partial [Tanacetum coccineum]
VEQPIPHAPVIGATNQEFEDWNKIYHVRNEELESMFEKQARVESYVEQLEHLGYVLSQDINVGLILNGLTSDFAGFAATPQVMAIQGGRIQKANKKSLNAKGKGKGKGKGKDISVIPKDLIHTQQ